MSQTERWREPIAELPGAEMVEAKAKDGWRPVAIEWERGKRESESREPPKRAIPFGLRISADCRHLEIDPVEQDAMTLMLAMIAGDHPLSKIAAALNQKGYRTRAGTEWTQVGLFKTLPRLIEIAPDVLSEQAWSESKKRLLAAVS